ncbi:MAG TPA: hypothetical protein VMV27_06680 [Candidatus Binataceae bacterium]|nr:hypothetical protein [Candidatus Binataceae bacterium]
MEILTIATPGQPAGPCRGSCRHPGCLSMRQLASARCPQCRTLLGFGAQVIGSPPMHLRCARIIGIIDHAGAAPRSHPRPNRPV